MIKTHCLLLTLRYHKQKGKQVQAASCRRRKLFPFAGSSSVHHHQRHMSQARLHRLWRRVHKTVTSRFLWSPDTVITKSSGPVHLSPATTTRNEHRKLSFLSRSGASSFSKVPAGVGGKLLSACPCGYGVKAAMSLWIWRFLLSFVLRGRVLQLPRDL